MNNNNRYEYPPVFSVDATGHLPQQQHYHQHHPQMSAAGRMDPALVPCWTFPPARYHSKRRGCGGMTSAAGTLLIMVLLMVFAALGLGAYQIMKIQTELAQLKQELHIQTESRAPERLVGNPIKDPDQTKHSQAAHLMGQTQNIESNPLQWESHHGRAFTDGVVYRGGGLQVNETGLYFIYSRVDFLSKSCHFRDSVSHTVYVKRIDGSLMTLMGDRREGYCRVGSTEVWRDGSNLGSVHLLKKADWVFVNVSKPALMSKSPYNNYFGLFKLT
ncbi:tumor necrosis factor ligand superfamily member 6 [Hoplias malabaricus]|uniref:tumor necrosis factor ligand superfamily member 6 n=1 Tax=Hoplias malabaricus TaxID=27720 RepID=UPI003461B170